MASLNGAEKLSGNPLVRFFDVYFKQFHKIIFVNLLFFVCSLPAIIIEFLLYKLLGEINAVTLLLYIPLISPFCGGLILVSKKLANGEQIKIVSEFFNAVRKNILPLLAEGVLLFLALAVEYFALVTYYYMAHTNPMYWVAFALSILLGIFILFCLYTIPLMTVTVELKLKDIYKNAALLTVGAIKRNLSATVVLALFFMISASMCLIFGGTVSIAVSVLFAVLIVPASVCVIVSFNLFPKLQSDIIGKNKKTAANFAAPKDDELDNGSVAEIPSELLEGDPNEFVFYNGRMYKRSVLIEKSGKIK